MDAHYFVEKVSAMKCGNSFDFDAARELMIEIHEAIENYSIGLEKGLLLCDILIILIAEKAKEKNHV